MPTLAFEDRAAPTTRRPVFLTLLVLLRLVAAAHAVLAVLQPVWIGQYLDGGYALLTNHAIGGGVLILAAMILTPVAIGYAIAGGRWWVAAVGPVLFFAEGLQTGMGYSRHLAVHLPLGVAIVAAALALAIWTWTPSAARDRGPRAGRSR